MNETLDQIHQKRLVHGARFRSLPLNVACPARCAFCYESRVTKVLPHVQTAYLPAYDDAHFDVFRQMYARCREWEAATSREPLYGFLPTFEHTPQGITHFPMCDVFSAGLTHEQIEELVRIREGDTCLLYAVGLNIDPGFIAFLSRRYPETFRLHLSIVTFDPAIRRRLMSPKIDVEALRRVCSVTHQATFFLMLFTEEQLTNDVAEILASTTADNGGLFLHKLYHDRCSPKRVVEYSRAADYHREAAIRSLARMRRDGRPFMCSLGADIQACTRRREIAQLLEPCTGEPDEAVFCSPGAFPVVRDFFGAAENAVIPMESAFGGNLDLVQGGTVRGVVDQINGLLEEGRRLRRVVLPDAMFWIDGEYDVNGDRVGVISEAFPDIEVEVVRIPVAVIRSVVDLDDCLAYFDQKRGAMDE